MDVRSLYRQMASYDQWKSELQTQLLAVQAWFNQHKIKSPQASHALQQAIALLTDSEFTIACVGEFSRGKTELINALLYLDNGQRLLPSRPGRTTMCPTEIFYDPQQRTCVRLLPIETRRSSSSVDSFRRIPEKWVTYEFAPDDIQQISYALSQIAATKKVTKQEALDMGFDPHLLSHKSDPKDQVEIPAWRHALVNLDHPLLRQGLRIVDTPGLNALGNEPELTLNTLPHAQSIIFLLSADTGLTSSDMTIWREHIEILRESPRISVLVLLNKIDTLWDDLSSADDVAHSIRDVRDITAHELQLPIKDVVPISAKEGLIAKASGDKARLLRSSVLKMEMLLSERMLENQHNIADHPSIHNALSIINNTHQLLKRRIADNKRQLLSLSEQSDLESKTEALEKLKQNIKNAHSSYHKQALALRSSQRMLDNQREALLSPINSLFLEQIISSTLKQLNQSWTALGRSRAITDFFEALEQTLGNMAQESERANKVLKAIYNRAEHREASSEEMLKRQFFDPAPRQRQLLQLKHQAHQFRFSLGTVFTNKTKIVERFIRSLVREVRALYLDLEADVHRWAEDALSPLLHHNLYQKQLLERHMLQLANLNNDGRSLDSRISDLHDSVTAQEQALQHLENIIQYSPDNSRLSKSKKDAQVVQLPSVQQTEQASFS